MRQLVSAVHEAERDGAKDLAAARCNWDTLHQEEAQELRVSSSAHHLPSCFTVAVDDHVHVSELCVRKYVLYRCELLEL